MSLLTSTLASSPGLQPGSDAQQTSRSAVLDLRGVSKWYCRGESKTTVLDNIDLQVQTGECVFLLGPSGSGKTTLLSIIGCVLTAEAGDVCVLGHDLQRLDSTATALLRRDHIGFVFQKFHLIRGLTSQENAAVPLLLSGWTSARANRRAAEILEQVGLADFIKQQPNKMSVGQCQRVALARALVGDPKLILADEPTASLDAESGQQAMELLRQLTVDAGKTMVVVTHDHRILPYADRVFNVANEKLQEAVSPQPPIPSLQPSTHDTTYRPLPTLTS